ncbi:MAG: hypothetical protein VX519_02835 [Myxococcota bacterium]|nr:hypothetical protein [Myxococcota bacterium]
MFLVPSLFLLCFAAFAGDDYGVGEQPQEVRDPRVMAEYHRLSDEVQRLAERGIWQGVRKNFVELEALEVPLEYDDLLIGAQLARMDGNVLATQRYLKLAAPIKGTRNVIEWLWAIDNGFGHVALKVPEGKPAVLVAEVMPIVPDMRLSVVAASAVVKNGENFVGLLPTGAYTINGRPFRVEANQPVLEVVAPPVLAKNKRR